MVPGFFGCTGVEVSLRETFGFDLRFKSFSKQKEIRILLKSKIRISMVAGEGFEPSTFGL